MSVTLKKGKAIVFTYDLQDVRGELSINLLTIITTATTNVFPLDDIEDIRVVKKRKMKDSSSQHVLQLKTDTGGFHQFNLNLTEENEEESKRFVLDVQAGLIPMSSR